MKPHPDEKIDVTQIRITQAGCHAAVLGEFRAADRLLSAWADGVKDFAVDFEVKFEDGYAYRGHYAYRRRSRGRPSLSKFVLREHQADRDSRYRCQCSCQMAASGSGE